MLDVAIGLVLIFALAALLATTIQEMIAAFLDLRGKALAAALQRLLGDDPIMQAVQTHPLIIGASKDQRPTYVEPVHFATVLMQKLGAVNLDAPEDAIKAAKTAVDSITNPQVKETLTTLIDSVGKDYNALTAALEGWFNAAMDRLSGEYKRQSQWIGFLIGLCIAIAFNIDTVSLTYKLWNDSPADRTAIFNFAKAELQVQSNQAPKPVAATPAAESAEAAATPSAAPSPTPSATPAPTAMSKVDAQVTTLLNPNLPLGWTAPQWSDFLGTFGSPPAFGKTALQILGWIIAAFALSLGGPFWFDLLQKLVNLRGAGPQPGSPRSAKSKTAR